MRSYRQRTKYYFTIKKSTPDNTWMAQVLLKIDVRLIEQWRSSHTIKSHTNETYRNINE